MKIETGFEWALHLYTQYKLRRRHYNGRIISFSFEFQFVYFNFVLNS